MFLPITSLAFATLPPEEIQTASGLYNLMRNLGGAIGLAITNSSLQNWTKRNYLQFRENIDSTNSSAGEAISLFENNFSSHNYFDPAMAAVKSLYQMALREAYIITFNQVFTHVAFLFFAGVLIMPFIKKLNSNNSTSAGH